MHFYYVMSLCVLRQLQLSAFSDSYFVFLLINVESLGQAITIYLMYEQE